MKVIYSTNYYNVLQQTEGEKGVKRPAESPHPQHVAPSQREERGDGANPTADQPVPPAEVQEVEVTAADDGPVPPEPIDVPIPKPVRAKTRPRIAPQGARNLAAAAADDGDGEVVEPANDTLERRMEALRLDEQQVSLQCQVSDVDLQNTIMRHGIYQLFCLVGSKEKEKSNGIHCCIIIPKSYSACKYFWHFFQAHISDLDEEGAKSLLRLVVDRLPREVMSIVRQAECPTHTPAPYCICGMCAPMETPRMDLCCGLTPCITTKQTFYDLCLKPNVIEIAGILNYAEHFFDLPDFSASKFRNQSYRFYTLWQHGKLGKGNRKCPPSCVVLAVRRQFPAPDGHYRGYESVDEDGADI